MDPRLHDLFKARVVAMILDSKPEDALRLLGEHFGVETPKIRVGVVKGRSKKVRAVYLGQKAQILAAKMEYLYDPFTVLHEFYHHLRYFGHIHRGTEKYANGFAKDFIDAYKRTVFKT